MRPKTRALIAAALAVVVVVSATLGYLVFWVLPYVVVQNHAIGANVTVSGKVPRNIGALVDNVSGASFRNTTALTPIVHITPDGSLPATVTLTFKLTRQLQPGEIALVATSQSDHGPWTLVQPTISTDGWYLIVRTNHLSWWQPLWFDLKQATSDFKTEFLDSLSGDATTQAVPPHCDNEAAARQDDYVITSSAKNTLYWCFGVEDGQRVLKVVNHMRYPLEVSHAGFTVKHVAPLKLELDELSRLVAGPDTILYPFEEADYTVDLAMNRRAEIDTRYDGLSQSLYQLEVGATTAVDMLTVFGAGSKVLKTAKMSGDTFAVLVSTTDKFLQIAECAGALLDLHSGSVVKGCFSPADMIKAFGWKGLLLAPIMALGSLVEFFHSSLDSIVDLITGNDRYTVIVGRLNTSSFVGQWHVHGAGMTIGADGTGTQSWNAGPCLITDPSTPWCTGNADIAFTMNADGTITGTLTRVWYTTWDGSPAPAGNDPSMGEPYAGDMFTLRLINPQLLIETWIKPLSFNGAGNPYWCGSSYSGPECGA